MSATGSGAVEVGSETVGCELLNAPAVATSPWTRSLSRTSAGIEVGGYDLQ